MILSLLIIVLTSVVSFAALRDPKLMSRLILWPPPIRRNGEYYRLLSYGLVHADMGHLLFNMVTLFFFGSAMANLYGRYLGALGFLLFYAGGLLVSILPSYLRNRDNANYRSLGASGAVSAVLFAFILLQPWATIIVFVVPMPAIVYAVLFLGYTFWMDRQRRDNINHSAHLWGALYGVVFTVIMEPRVVGVFLEQLAQPRFGI